jgi:hypothetical protein
MDWAFSVNAADALDQTQHFSGASLLTTAIGGHQRELGQRMDLKNILK